MAMTDNSPTRTSSIRSFVSGLFSGTFAANAVPHIYFGLLGMDHMTPFGPQSSPAVNLVWGIANALFAVLIARFGPARGVAIAPALLGGVVGAAGTVISLVILWS